MEELAIKIASDLIKINSVNPAFGGNGEKEKAEYVKKIINDFIKIYNIHNYSLKEYNVKDKNGFERPNIVFKINFNREKSLHIISHLDTVPEGDIKLWETPPYEPVIKDGKIYGRGAEDNHKAIVSSLLLIPLIYESGLNPKYNLSLIFVSDEEAGSEYGLKYLLNFENEIFKKDDIIIVPDFSSKNGELIEIGEKGILWVLFSFIGSQCHGSTPEEGLNSNLIAFNFSNLLYNKLYNKYNKRDEIFLPPYSTFEPTIVKNNVTNPNTIPGYTEVAFDCRILPCYKIDDILEDIKKAINEFDFKKYINYFSGEPKIEYKILQRQEPNYTDKQSETIEELKRAIKNVLHVEPKLCGMGGGTVAAFLRYKGYNVAVWGIGEGTAHQPNEHIKIEDLIKMAKVFYEILK
ncbi:diaminopimelate aminotransferase [Methanocaldococcus villosus KIN24-T80]|uniref:Diaminopimelate aminotransferase n=1 Tax=Methanocaldococcus villosus KIN24-T80 TaxID=1069083 RepID=N6W041_9EURY|nr:M20 family metallo-hydrolase [Methanocaldococcus villosus]ENN96722.1 diaminopimelate aminotransferase [Methanocaldococcus villosus KIN24-T80]